MLMSLEVMVFFHPAVTSSVEVPPPVQYETLAGPVVVTTYSTVCSAFMLSSTALTPALSRRHHACNDEAHDAENQTCDCHSPLAVLEEDTPRMMATGPRKNATIPISGMVANAAATIPTTRAATPTPFLRLSPTN